MPSRTQLQIRVTYDAPVSDCRRVLRVLPLLRANQRILNEHWRVHPKPTLQTEKPDEFGNRRLFIYHQKIDRQFELELELEVHTHAQPLFQSPSEAVGRWRLPSRAVDFSEAIIALSRSLRNQPAGERARSLCTYCFQNLSYTAQTSSSPLPASQIWERKIGTCADFSHLFLSLCRASGLPARYVAGFNPAEGQMHAWTEVLIESQWIAFDPTHGRVPTPGCIAVATGRDYYDCKPHLGSFRGLANAEIMFHCRTKVI